MAGVPISAKNAVVRVNGSTLYASEWTVNSQSVLDDATNFEGGGFEQSVACTTHAEVDINGWYDSSANMFDPPLELQDGATVDNLTLYINEVGSAHWLFPVALVESAQVIARVKEKINYRLRLKSTGLFDYPTGE